MFVYSAAYVISFFIGFINPFIGWFAAYNFIQLLVIYLLARNGTQKLMVSKEEIKKQLSESKEDAAEELVDEVCEVIHLEGKSLWNGAFVCSITFSIIYAVLCFVLWMFNMYSYFFVDFSPIDLFNLSEHPTAATIFVILSVLCNFAGIYGVVKERKKALKLCEKDEEKDAVEGEQPAEVVVPDFLKDDIEKGVKDTKEAIDDLEKKAEKAGEEEVGAEAPVLNSLPENPIIVEPVAEATAADQPEAAEAQAETPVEADAVQEKAKEEVASKEIVEEVPEELKGKKTRRKPSQTKTTENSEKKMAEDDSASYESSQEESPSAEPTPTDIPSDEVKTQKKPKQQRKPRQPKKSKEEKAAE
jgi:hypothetical protein